MKEKRRKNNNKILIVLVKKVKSIEKEGTVRDRKEKGKIDIFSEEINSNKNNYFYR